ELLAGCVFFFQAEDGIRDKLVTGVQTCALPISRGLAFLQPDRGDADTACGEDGQHGDCAGAQLAVLEHAECRGWRVLGERGEHEIGRASCREREWAREVSGSDKESLGYID